ncbi:MAG: hypothetical protein HY290_26015 [Planctomycetia bacterium]|nr:hypothetical protein [Planctomycetia bacterium]
MIGGMEIRSDTLAGAMIAVALHCIVIPATFLALIAAPGIFAVPFGVVFIWFVVRCTNRRDDPRHAKLPPDAP